MELNVKMQNGYVMVKDLPIVENITKSGLILPKAKYQRVAEIVAVCEGSKFKVGEHIIKPIGRGTPVTIDDVMYECVKEEVIFAKV